MAIYFKSIIYELANNAKYVKLIIRDNILTDCSNSIIRKDIEKKLEQIELKINYVEFYSCVYDYGIEASDVYWNTMKNLDRKNLPIYRIEDDLEEFFQWMNKNFNNNNIRIYETNKFTKRKYIFRPDEKNECLQSVKYSVTNSKFNTFNQLLYHAGDYDDIERFGYLYVRTEYSKLKKLDLNEISKSNIYYSLKVEPKIWEKFDVNFASIKNTMYYMFEKMKKGILVGIKNNKLLIFLPFSNSNYKNDFYTELYFDSNDKKNLSQYKKNPNLQLKIKLEKTLKYYLNKYKLNTKNILWDRTKWVANDCFFRYENYEGDKSVGLYEDFFVNLCAQRELPDCIFFLNVRDHPMLNKNLMDGYSSIVDKPLDSKYIFEKYTPILSPGGSIETADICMCTQDDWLRTSKLIYPDDCANGYINSISMIQWENKKPCAVFRGSATGCGMGDDNPRIKAANLSKQYPEYLDAGITSFNRKLKKNLNKPLEIIDNSNLKKASFMTLQEKTQYKYILNLDGHVSAFRLGHEFSLGSVLLIPKSKYYLWFSYLLIPYEHFIPVEADLSNLIEQIKWCIENDSTCKKIASNGMEFYNKYLTEKGMFDYMQCVLNKISLNSLNLFKQKEKIAIITLYRNKPDNTRLYQKRLFVYWMNKLLASVCHFDIVIVEQSEKYLFNIGKLKNIGYDYLKNKLNRQYSNYIFADIDSIPDSDLIEYFFKQTDSLNALATFGTRYELLDSKNARPFVGALISCTSQVFEEINGYPNNFYGWQGEDENLLLRLYGTKKPLYINSKGKIIDTEEIDGMKKNLTIKINELNENKDRESHVYEKNINWENFKHNGLTNLNYEILYSNSFESKYDSNSSTHHIIVDLLMDQDKIKYPSDYFFSESYDKQYYKKFFNPKIFSIKQIKF